MKKVILMMVMCATALSLQAQKAIKITDTFSIPVFAQFVANPCSQKAYLVFGLTLQP